MRVEKTEYDDNRFEVILHEGVSWVISLDKLKELHKLISAEITIHNIEYKSATPQLNQLRKLLLDQKQLDPEINKLVNENFWELI